MVSTLLLGFRSIISSFTLIREIYIYIYFFALSFWTLIAWHCWFGIPYLDTGQLVLLIVRILIISLWIIPIFSLSLICFFFFFPLQKLIKWNLFRYYCAAFETTILLENEYHNNKWKGKAWNHISQSNNEKLKPFHWNSTIIIH